jgi:hypothetical protein
MYLPLPPRRSASVEKKHRHSVILNASLYFRDIRLYRIGFTVELMKYSVPEKTKRNTLNGYTREKPEYSWKGILRLAI